MAKTQSGKSNLGAATPVVPTTIPLNGKTLMYRIALSDMDVMAPSDAPDGFVHYNQTNGNVFESVGGIWTAWGPVGNLDDIDPTLIDRWFGTTPTQEQTGVMVDGNPIQNQTGFRVGCSDRKIGEIANAPEGFLVYNQTNKKTFVVASSVWADGGTFPADLYSAWLDAAVSYVKSNNIFHTGRSRIS